MYTLDMKVGSSHSDVNHRMTIPAIIDAYQDVSCFHSEELGVGFFYLEPRKLVWVLNYWEVEFKRLPEYPETITVGTFPYEFRGFMGMRNFFLKDEKGEFISKANSLWVLMDWENMRPVKVPEEIYSAYTLEDKLDMNYSSRKISIPDGVIGIAKEPMKIGEHHLDANGHVNNGQYVKIAMSYIPQTRDYTHLRVEYRAQAHLGDLIYPMVYESDSAVNITLNNEEGTPYACLELKY